MSSTSCARCGVMNASDLSVCGRCGLATTGERRRGLKSKIVKSALRIFGLAGLLLFLAYASLITTSDPIAPDQSKMVDRAIDTIEKRGFRKEAFVLRHLARYRATDNWWNRWVGHDTAYAATNFPFQVVTLYPSFFDAPIDDTERAVILLHESYHLFGFGEPGAFEGTWLDKQTLGWTSKDYGNTAVWNSVRVATSRYAPHVFQCGPDGVSDCVE